MNKTLLYWGLGLAALVAGAGFACPTGLCSAPGFDRAGLAMAQSMQSPWLDELMRAATWLGSLWLLLPLALMLAWFQSRRAGRPAAIFLVSALAGASLVAHLAKLWVARPRPEDFPMLVASPLDWAYPSAHTMQAAAFALALVLLGRRSAAWWWLGLAPWVLLVAWSRIHLQVHFPSDVLFGGVAAAFWVLGLHALIIRRQPHADAEQEARP